MKTLRLTTLFVCLMAWTNAFGAYVVGAFNPQWSYWQQSDLNYNFSRGQNFFLGKIFEWGHLEANLSDYHMQTGSGTLSYEDNYQSFVLVAAKTWTQKEINPDIDLELYYLGGLGAARNVVRSEFQGNHSKRTSDLRILLQGGVGTAVFFDLPEDLRLLVGAEAKLQRDSEVTPVNFMTLQLRVGLLF